MILVDENIPLARELFGSLGEVRVARGREIAADYPGIERVEVLAIRSVTKVTRALVDVAVSLRVIGTATIGTDHIDTDYITRANAEGHSSITVVSAPGSNADSVADYVGYALVHLTRNDPEPLSSKTIGIVGYGNCGSRVGRRAEAVGMRVLANDPPLAESSSGFVSVPLEEALQADFVTLHVPLTTHEESKYPTYHMIGRNEIARMRSDAYLFNMCRGGVVNSPDLIGALKDGRIRGPVLDVYQGEPEPVPELIELPLIATPHVAGYASEGKTRGAVMVYEGICEALGVEPMDTGPLVRRSHPAPQAREVRFEPADSLDLSAERAVRALMNATYDISATSARLKATLGNNNRGELFDRLRKDYALNDRRHELAVYGVELDDSIDTPLAAAIGRRLEGFGMNLAPAIPHYILTM